MIFIHKEPVCNAFIKHFIAIGNTVDNIPHFNFSMLRYNCLYTARIGKKIKGWNKGIGYFACISNVIISRPAFGTEG